MATNDFMKNPVISLPGFYHEDIFCGPINSTNDPIFLIDHSSTHSCLFVYTWHSSISTIWPTAPIMDKFRGPLIKMALSFWNHLLIVFTGTPSHSSTVCFSVALLEKHQIIFIIWMIKRWMPSNMVFDLKFIHFGTFFGYSVAFFVYVCLPFFKMS